MTDLKVIEGGGAPAAPKECPKRKRRSSTSDVNRPTMYDLEQHLRDAESRAEVIGEFTLIACAAMNCTSCPPINLTR
jgi:hypothetical protein